MERDLPEAEAAGHDDLREVAGPFRRRRVGEIPVEAQACPLHLPALAQVRRGPGERLRAVALPLLQVGPVSDVGRDQVADRPQRLDRAVQARVVAGRRVEPDTAVGQPHHRHPHG